jgi:hypothetical protein
MQQESQGKRSTEVLEKPKRKSKKKSTKSKGLGDDIEKLTKASGIKAVVDKVAELTNTDCGCDKRKAWLNKNYPRKHDMSEGDQLLFKTIIKPKLKNGAEVDMAWQETFISIYFNTFGRKLKKRGCKTCFLKDGELLEKAYLASCE